jgi:hypothetical protein
LAGDPTPDMHLKNIYWTFGIPAATLPQLLSAVSHPKTRSSNFGIWATLKLEILQEEFDEKL